MPIDCITFGSATVDFFVRPKKARVVRDRLFLPFPDKIETEEFFIDTGGAGTNVACALAHFGFEVAYIGKLGKDIASLFILEDLKRFGVKTDWVIRDDLVKTNLSVVLSAKTDRTILTYHSASLAFKASEVPWDLLSSTSWVYLNSFSGPAMQTFEKILRFCSKNNTPVYWNPSKTQLSHRSFFTWIKKADFLQLNEKEALLATRKRNIQRAGKELAEIKGGGVIITLGKKGALFWPSSKEVWKIPSFSVKVKERTGAGDAFASGFIAGLLKGLSTEDCLRLAISNSVACLKERGAKSSFWPPDKPPLQLRIRKQLI